jgi:hypothetical protein
MNDKTKNAETDDTEGNSMHWSDAEVKHDVTPIGTKSDPQEVDDTEGNNMHWSDAEVKHDVTPVRTKTDTEADDTEGNSYKFGG